ncbi:transcriptional regulator [Sphingorhabdus sp.]|uniref:winged helix-turn-helix domain-containing protein n=1 Tax=Sphingorhabdus sp. TaxID=1902408 RepID=UPI0039199737
MKSDRFRFGPFTLDVESRLLCRDGVALDVSSRYFDALVLLVRNAGGLVPKDRFMEDVWSGVPVTDEALTQCIRSLRRALQDDAARPRFIETVPKHGYRFIAAVNVSDALPVVTLASASRLDWRTFWALGGAGIVGGGVAGLLGGIFYGFAGGSQGMGGASIVLVLTALTVLIALIGAAGVSFGMAAAGLFNPRTGPSTILGGGAGGFLIGGIVKLLGLDAFYLLLGQSPTHITGALEGAVLGAAVGLGLYLGSRAPSSQSLLRRMLVPAAVGAVAGAAIPAAGGQLLGGSLNALAGVLPQSRLRLDQIGALFGEDGFGPISQMVTGGLEGMLFAASMTGAILLAQRQITE